MERLEQSAIDAALTGLDDWKQTGNAIEKSFEFSDFSEATGFLMRVAMISERLDHHAEYSGVYNKLTLKLSTHDAGGLTALDVRVAGEIDALSAD